MIFLMENYHTIEINPEVTNQPTIEGNSPVLTPSKNKVKQVFIQNPYHF